MKKKIELYLEQDEIHKIIIDYFKLGDVILISDVNSGRTTFEYETEEENLK